MNKIIDHINRRLEYMRGELAAVEHARHGQSEPFKATNYDCPFEMFAAGVSLGQKEGFEEGMQKTSNAYNRLLQELEAVRDRLLTDD